jgi:hypothetical protein
MGSNFIPLEPGDKVVSSCPDGYGKVLVLTENGDVFTVQFTGVSHEVQKL